MIDYNINEAVAKINEERKLIRADHEALLKRQRFLDHTIQVEVEKVATSIRDLKNHHKALKRTLPKRFLGIF